MFVVSCRKMKDMVTIVHTETSALSPEGRVVIPASVRRQLALKPGDVLAFRVVDGRVLMTTQETALRKLQAMFAEQPPRIGVLLSDELIAERRAEARRENEG